jgi:hypothetical protein
MEDLRNQESLERVRNQVDLLMRMIFLIARGQDQLAQVEQVLLSQKPQVKRASLEVKKVRAI